MTREDKETLYHFLDTAYRALAEGTVKKTGMPVFADDAALSSLPEESLDSIASRVALCADCALCSTRKNAVPGVGVRNPLVMVIGEAPGADEDVQGEPFVGKAGQLLDKMLSAIGLSRNTNCYIANIVKCRPPENRDPLPEEASACAPYLSAQIAILKPAAILAVGRVAAQSLLGTKDGIGELHGRFYDYHGILLMPTYHPSALLRDESLKRPSWEDLKKLRTELNAMAPAVTH